MDRRLAGKRAFVTGAGQGIGRAVALAFAHEGARVWAASRTFDKMHDLPRIAPGILPVELDVTDGAAIHRAMADAGAVQMTKNPEAMMTALMRIAGRANIPQAPADIDMMCFENAQAFLGLFATHPPIDSRIKVLSEMTNTPVPALRHAGPAPADRSFGDRNRRNPWLSAQRKNSRNV